MDGNFSISTEGLTEKGKDIANESKNIKAALADIESARTLLEGWVSQNKEAYDAKLVQTLPKMTEMTEVIDSYAGVAVQTSEKAIAVENKIAAAIDNNYIG